MKHIIIITLLFIFTSTFLIADKYAGEFLNLGVGVKAKSMGNSFVAIADNPSAIYWNPSGIQNLKHINFEIMHAEEFSGNLKFDSFALNYPLKNKTQLGFLITRIGISGIPYTKLENPEDTISASNPPYTYKKVSNADYTGYLSFSANIIKKLYWGITSKFIYKKIDDISATGLGLDVGFLYRINNFSFGLNIRDLFGSTIWWENSLTEKVNTNIIAGLAIDFQFPIIKKPATISYQNDIFFEDRDEAAQLHYKKISVDFHTGLIINIAKPISVQCGLDCGNPTGGLELKYQKYLLNYAFHYYPDFSNSHRISFGMNL